MLSTNIRVCPLQIMCELAVRPSGIASALGQTQIGRYGSNPVKFGFFSFISFFNICKSFRWFVFN